MKMGATQMVGRLKSSGGNYLKPEEEIWERKRKKELFFQDFPHSRKKSGGEKGAD